VFFVDSTKNLANHHFSGLILGLNEVGARFTYSKDFALPISIKGTSNFLPMKHSIIKENPFLELAFLTLGMQGMGKTHLFSDFNYGFEEILNQLNANFIYKPEEIAVSLQSQTLSKQLEITL
jgi:hypothetical protein